MSREAVIAVFDIGKTNKKLFLYNESYEIVFERTAKFNETTDEDGFPCDNLDALIQSAKDALKDVLRMPEYDVRAVNFTTYGASFVYVDGEGKPLTPLYNYLKDYPEALTEKFYEENGGKLSISLQTASPVLGSLNSGMQVYRLKYERPDLFSKIKYALHLPQFMSFLFTGKAYTDLTSIGCHTHLWDFNLHKYHAWVEKEKLDQVFAPIFPGDRAINFNYDEHSLLAGAGLHDSSAALIPYLVSFREPFALISSGTWCITLNPFNETPLTEYELTQDCLCYLTYTGKPVKASRIFSGNEHEHQIKRLASHFSCDVNTYKQVCLDTDLLQKLTDKTPFVEIPKEEKGLKTSDFGCRNLYDFSSYEEAYHRLILDLVKMQVESSMMVLSGTTVRRLFVDGGFSRNQIFMHLLADAFPAYEIYAASVAQATSLGAALALHSCWNTKPVPSNLIELKYLANSRNDSMS
ncbi:MAG: FGGY family carbohydrate kinase [Chitinophagaceae bacterium]|nr:FGGY family carbohydrate kinase [Chitinophagaceae bacterium]